MQTGDVEPDLTRVVADPSMDAHAHPEGAEPEVLMDTEGDQLLEEDGTVGENASIEEDRDPHVELQEPGVSHLATLEEAEFLTFMPSPFSRLLGCSAHRRSTQDAGNPRSRGQHRFGAAAAVS